MMTVDVKELQRFRAQLHDARREIRAALEKESRRFAPILIRSAQAHARGEVEKRIAQSGQARIVQDGFVVTFGASGKVSGAPLRKITRQYEFGTNTPDEYRAYRTRSPKGRAYRARRRTKRQIPSPASDGRFLYPALADVTPKLVSGYVRAIVNTVTDA